MKRLYRKPNSRRPGSALVAVILVLMMLSLLGGAIMTLTMHNLRMGDRQRRVGISFSLAEAGAERAMAWVRLQSELGNLPTSETSIAATNLGDGTYSAVITPDVANSTLDRKMFTVTATGTANGRTETVQIAMRQSSFGRYAYFSDYEVSSISGNPIWFKAGETLDGPVHSNNATATYNEGGVSVTAPTHLDVNYNGSTSPIFMHEVTASSDDVIYNPGDPTTETDFRKVYDEGSSGYHLDVEPIELPKTSDRQRNAAWGATSGFPTDNGVYVANNGATATGGIYIKGDSEIVMSVSGGNQVFAIKQGSNTTTITFNKSTNQTDVVKPDGTVLHYDGLTNGVVFSADNITKLEGTIADNQVSGTTITKRNAYTICTDQGRAPDHPLGPAAGKKVTITGNIQYQTPPDKTQPPTHSSNLNAGTLGIVSKDVMVSSSAPQNTTIHAVVLASGYDGTADATTSKKGSFWNEVYNTRTPPGDLNLIGGLIQRRRGAVGTFNAATGQTATGFTKKYSYDPRMADNPPPYFPTTNKFDNISWKRQ
jgi:Tfp pilus assembly protein PilX